MGRDDWVALALRLLAEKGPSALTVDALCAAAGRTRGSLYHHFRDHDALLSAVVERWREDHTERLVRDVEELPDDRAGAALNDLAMALDPRIETGIRGLAARHPQLLATVRAADARRVAFLAALHERSGALDAADARVVAEVEYAAYVGLQYMGDERDPEQIARLYGRFEALVRRT